MRAQSTGGWWPPHVCANEVVYRLQDVEEVIKASEHWQDEKALPLPHSVALTIRGRGANGRHHRGTGG